MSRYVDLNGLTWDGTTISSKIQEVKTEYGFMSAITIGWLYSDNVPHIDLDEYESDIRADERRKFAEWCKIKGYSCYDWNMLVEQYEKEKRE